MTCKKNVALIGGDRRQYYIGKNLHDKGFDIYSLAGGSGFNVCCSLEEILRKCDILVLPIPAIKDSQFINTCTDSTLLVKDLLSLLNSSQHILFGGCLNDSFKLELSKSNIPFYDFMSDECVSWYNSVATAEGAIMEAIKESPSNISSSHCLVTGFGKCGIAIATRLRAFNANVTIAARRDEVKAMAKSLDFNTIDINSIYKTGEKYDFIFNTVPALVIDERVIDSLQNEVLIIDIASYPGGTNFSYARSHQIKALLKLSIPGRISPKSSGFILSDFILKRILERL